MIATKCALGFGLLALTVPDYGTHARLQQVARFIDKLGRVAQTSVDPSRRSNRAVSISQNFDALIHEGASDFHNLAEHYRGQETDSACSLASTTMVLNAFRQAKGRPGPKTISPAEVLEKVPGTTWERAVAQGSTGLTLDQLHTEVRTTLNVFGFPEHEVTAVHTADASPERLAKLKRDLIENDADDNILIIANFDQGALLGGEPAGHFSPVGDYDPVTDRVLIMDTDRQTADPYWVPVDTFLKSMTGIDSDSGLSRGYLIVRLK